MHLCCFKTCITLFCRNLCRLRTTTTWNDLILSELESGNGKAKNFTISVNLVPRAFPSTLGTKLHICLNSARSPIFRSNLNCLLSCKRVTWDNRQIVWTNARSVFQRRFHSRCRCRMVRSEITRRLGYCKLVCCREEDVWIFGAGWGGWGVEGGGGGCGVNGIAKTKKNHVVRIR